MKDDFNPEQMMLTKDPPNNITAYVASAVMFEIISLIAYPQHREEAE